MLRVSITGASGFVGRNLLSDLGKEDFELQALDLRQALPADVFNNIDAVVHLAGKAHDLKNTSVVADYFTVNFELTKILVDEFLRSAARVFIFISSVKAVRDSVEGTLVESDVPQPETAYGKSKLEAEKYLLANQLPGKKIFILRPCMIHGPGNKGNLNLLFKLVRSGIPYPLGAFENKRSFLSVQNLSFVIRELLQRTDIPAGIYNVADNTPLATSTVIQIISDVLEKKPVLWRINKKLVRVMAKTGDLFRLPFTTVRLNKLTENYIVSNRKLIEALKKDLPLDSGDGLRITIQSFLDDK